MYSFALDVASHRARQDGGVSPSMCAGHEGSPAGRGLGERTAWTRHWRGQEKNAVHVQKAPTALQDAAAQMRWRRTSFNAISLVAGLHKYNVVCWVSTSAERAGNCPEQRRGRAICDRESPQHIHLVNVDKLLTLQVCVCCWLSRP